MNTSTTTARTTANGFLRRTTAGSLLVMAITATAVGLAATSHADPGAPDPNTQSPIYAPAPVGPWVPAIDPGCRAKLYYFNGRWHCG